MSDAIDRVAAAMWAARWRGAPFGATWDQAGDTQQRDYRIMAEAAIECILSGEAEGDGLAQRGETCTGMVAPAVATVASDPQANGATTADGAKRPVMPAGIRPGRQPSPSAYTPTAPPAEPDPRTPDDWDGGDEPPRDADGLTPAEAAALAREEGRKYLCADEDGPDPETIPF